MRKAWAWAFSAALSFGEVLRKEKHLHKNDLWKTKKTAISCVKVFQVYPVKYILECFITKSVQKNTRS